MKRLIVILSFVVLLGCATTQPRPSDPVQKEEVGQVAKDFNEIIDSITFEAVLEGVLGLVLLNNF